MEHKLGEHWHTFQTLKKPLLLQDLDFAVRENVKSKIQFLILSNIETFVEKGLTYDDLKVFQKELDLCPSILELYPQKEISFFERVLQIFRK